MIDGDSLFLVPATPRPAPKEDPSASAERPGVEPAPRPEGDRPAQAESPRSGR